MSKSEIHHERDGNSKKLSDISIITGNIATHTIAVFTIFRLVNITQFSPRIREIIECISDILDCREQELLNAISKRNRPDIYILTNIIDEYSLEIELISNIVDLQDFFPNLKTLEQSLTKQVGINRTTTEKGKYSEYYKLFKGQARTGYNKKIEPIGTYNLTDILTPLFMYLILNTK